MNEVRAREGDGLHFAGICRLAVEAMEFAAIQVGLRSHCQKILHRN
jgi:hypothetical protein